MTRAFFRSLVLGVAVAGTLLGAPAGEAKPVQPPLSPWSARVATGVQVKLAAPALTPGELAALRPHWEDLKPRVRGNGE